MHKQQVIIHCEQEIHFYADKHLNNVSLLIKLCQASQQLLTVLKSLQRTASKIISCASLSGKHLHCDSKSSVSSVTLPGLLQLLLGEERADVHGVTELHVGQFTGHGDGCIPAAQRSKDVSTTSYSKLKQLNTVTVQLTSDMNWPPLCSPPFPFFDHNHTERPPMKNMKN